MTPENAYMDTRMDFVDSIVEQLDRELPGIGAEAIAPIARFSRLGIFLRRHVVEVLDQHELSESEYNVLAALRRSGPPYALAPSVVSRSLLFTSGGLTPVLDRLADRGLLVREPDETDRRKLRIRLTPQGLDLHTAALRSHIRVSRELLAPLQPEERELLSGLLRALLVTFEDVETA